MPTYRAAVRHVRYWRGVVHRWSTVYHFTGAGSVTLSSADAQSVLNADRAMCYTGVAANGGTYECDLYNQASGGVPVATYRAFDPSTPGAWVADPGASWGSTGSFSYERVAETALLVEWNAGLSSSGKGVRLRKWYHAVPVAATGSGAAQEIPAASITALTTGATSLVGVLGAKGLTMSSATGRLAGAAAVQPFYGNHQMARGRRRKISSQAKQAASYEQVLRLVENQAYSQANS